jgi:4,5-dihydroxyphthalate decarboxylase
MSRLHLTLACWKYDRTRALFDGEVQPDGIDLTCLNLPVEETFFRMLRHREFDAAEMSLSSYTLSRAAKDPAFIAIPAFVSRCFRHGSIFVSGESRIGKPADLVGKRIGVPEYQMTAPVWIRGILQDEYGVAPDSVEYFCGGEEETGRDEKIAINLPPQFSLRSIGPDQTLSQMIAEGAIDALFTARAPSTFLTRHDAVRRLFPNYVAVEHDYYRRTKIFPIMHVVVIRSDVYEANRWVAQSLFKAFVRAQRLAYDELTISAALKTMLPWQLEAVDEVRQLMGPDWWSYGLTSNRHVLTTFLRYHHEHGLSPRRLEPEELFAPETLESFKI